MSSKSSYALKIFEELRDSAIEPYRRANGLEWLDLPFIYRLGQEFLVADGVKPGSKVVIRVVKPFNSEDVIIIDERYRELGRQIKTKLEDIKKFC